MPDTERPRRKREFIKETIVAPPLSRREIVKRLAVYACMAAVFGVIAAFSFVLAQPLASQYLGEEETAESSSVHFPQDEPETLPPETVREETQPVREEEERIQEAVEEVIGEYTLTSERINSFYGVLRDIGQQAGYGIVTVRSGKQQSDLFGNPVENTGDYAGAIIARTRGEYLIFTSADAVREASSILVAFYDGSKVAGEVKQIDEVLDMAVVSVPARDISEQVRSGTEVLVLGNSYAMRVGDPVIGVGGPAGTMHSMTFGMISYVARNVSLTDGMTRILYADLGSDARMGTFLLNTSGEIIGWVSDEYNTEGGTSRTTAVSISEYKGILEKMSNGIPCPYFGIRGQEVSESVAEENGIPRGVYVTEAVSGGPAYDAGIQNGDVITRFAREEILTFKELQTQIEEASIEEPVLVEVMRRGREGYTELEYEVHIRAR